jgi:hypothetical protein
MSDYSFMKSGFGSGSEPIKKPLSGEDIEHIEILLSLFISNSISNASKYVTHCGRNGVSKEDINYALKYEVFEFLNNKNINADIKQATEDYHEYLEEEDSDDEEADEEAGAEASTGTEAEAAFIIPDEEVDEFARIDPSLVCDENREFIEKYHNHFDKWDSWQPVSPLDIILKNAIDKIDV